MTETQPSTMAAAHPPTGQLPRVREPAPTTSQIRLPASRQPAVPPLPGGGLVDDPSWYRTAVFYEVMLRSFSDSTGTGSGDLRGLIDRLDYLL